VWVLTKNRKILINLNALTDVYLTERGEDAEVAIDLPCGETIIIASGKTEEKEAAKVLEQICSALERGDALCRLG
jgi:hypothetical protein